MRREFVVAAYVVNGDKVLLVNHKKLKKWLPLGGHIEKDELPDEAVVREVKEESGLDVKIVSENYTDSKSKILSRPILIALEDINDEHQHIDLQYVCKLRVDDKLNGTEECRWFNNEELAILENCSDAVKHFSREAIKIIKSLN